MASNFSPSCSCIAVESAGGALGSSVAWRFEAAHGFELRFVGGPVQVEVVTGGEAGVVDDRLVHDGDCIPSQKSFIVELRDHQVAGLALKRKFTGSVGLWMVSVIFGPLFPTVSA